MPVAALDNPLRLDTRPTIIGFDDLGAGEKASRLTSSRSSPAADSLATFGKVSRFSWGSVPQI